MENKEKPLEKMTAQELREMALGLSSIEGVHAMKKEELIAAIRAARGLPHPQKKVILTTAELKKQIKELKLKKAEALEQGKRSEAALLRKQISRLKKRTRRTATKEQQKAQ